MTFDFRASIPATLVVLGCFLAVFVRVLGAPKPSAKAPLAPADQAMVAALFRDNEARWNERAGRHFPADDWSARDDFHAQELGLVESLVGRRGFTVEDVYRALDEDLRASPSDRNVRAVPCKPRPFYD